MGGTLGFMQLRRKVQSLWGKAGKVDPSDIGNGYMIATFDDPDDYYFALEGGPWLIQNHYLMVQTWKRNFNPWKEKLHRLAIWVRLLGLPGDYYDCKFFYHLGNGIGKAIRVDDMTLSKARTMFTRMCVEIDLNAPLLPSYIVDGNELKIEYEGLHLICFYCGKFGHDSDHCPSKIQQAGVAANITKQTQAEARLEDTVEEVPASRFREWMIAQNPRRGRRSIARESRPGETFKKVVRMNSKVGQASKFAILEVEEERGTGEKMVHTDRRLLQEISNITDKEKKKQSRLNPRKKAGEGTEMARVRQGRSNGEETTDGQGKREAGEKTKAKGQRKNRDEVGGDEAHFGGKIDGMKCTMGKPTGHQESQFIGPGINNENGNGLNGEASLGQELHNANGQGEEQGMVLDENILTHVLESPPDKIGETMELDEGRPPDPLPGNSQALLGLSAVEKLIQRSEEPVFEIAAQHEKHSERSMCE